MSVLNRWSAPERPSTRAPLSRLAIPLICLAQLMATLDVTIVNLAVPSIHRDLDLSAAGLAWVIDAYTLAYAGALLVGGRAGDLIGHRRMLMIGIGLFTASSLLAGVAADESVLLAARAGQGLGAAMATPTTLSLITTLTPPGPRRTRAMVAYGAMAGLGITLGLVLGGLLTQTASWRWVFLVNIPLGLLVLLSAPRVLPESHGTARRLDLAGAVTGTAALSALAYGVIRAGTHEWGELGSVVALAASVVLFAVFVVVESRVEEPMLPLPLLRHRVRLGAYLVAGLLFACLYPTFFLLSRALQDVLLLEPVAAGLRFLPIGLGVLVFAVAARRTMTRTGPRPLVVGGAAATALASLALSGLARDTTYVALLLPALVGLGAGVGTTFVANAALAMTDVPDHDAGVASGLLSTFQAVGGTVGVAVLASVAATRTESVLSRTGLPPSPDAVADALLSGFGLGFTIAAAAGAVAVVVAIATGRRRSSVYDFTISSL